MLSNLLGFDIGAELKCAETRHWIKQEEKRVARMSREYDTEEMEDTDDSDETEGKESVNHMDIFHKAVEKVNREREEKTFAENLN